MRASNSRLKRYRRLVIWTAVVGAVCAASDWPFGDVLGVDWESHPLWAGVLTGGLLLVAGYFGVETFLRERDAGKWEQVANIAFKAVGVSTGLLRDGMDRLIGFDEHLQVRRQPLTRGVIEGVVERQHALEMDSFPQHRRPRLERLAADRKWAFFAVEGLDQLKWQHRETLAQWAAIMLANAELADDFARLAELNEMVSRLQEPLRRRARIDVHDECPTDDSGEISRLIIDRWEAILTRSVLVQEDFVRAAGDKAWTHVGARQDLSEEAQQVLDQRDDETHSGRFAREPSRSAAQSTPSL